MSAVMGFIGVGVSAVGQLVQAKAAADVASYNAQVAEMEAKAIKISGEREAEKLKRAKKLTAAQQRAGYAKAGVRLEGSPFEVLLETATQYQMDIEATKYTTQVGISRKASEAYQYRERGAAIRTAGGIAAATTLLTGIGRLGYGAGR